MSGSNNPSYLEPSDFSLEADAKLQSFIHTIYEALNYITQYKALHELVGNIRFKDKNAFVLLLNNTACMATIRLANIFGTYTEENHWNYFVSDAEREQLYVEYFGSKNEYKKIHDNLVNFRNEYAIHCISDANGIHYCYPKVSEFVPFLYATLRLALEKYSFKYVDETIKSIQNHQDELYSSTKELFIRL